MIREYGEEKSWRTVARRLVEVLQPWLDSRVCTILFLAPQDSRGEGAAANQNNPAASASDRVHAIGVERRRRQEGRWRGERNPSCYEDFPGQPMNTSWRWL